MLGRDELCASVKQCLEILTRAQEYVEEISSPPSTFADLAALFEKFLCDLDEMDHKQPPPPTDDGMYKDKALSLLFNATLSLYNKDNVNLIIEQPNRLSHCTENIVDYTKINMYIIILFIIAHARYLLFCHCSILGSPPFLYSCIIEKWEDLGTRNAMHCETPYLVCMLFHRRFESQSGHSRNNQ